MDATWDKNHTVILKVKGNIVYELSGSKRKQNDIPKPSLPSAGTL
jgi:hypothetical protein